MPALSIAKANSLILNKYIYNEQIKVAYSVKNNKTKQPIKKKHRKTKKTRRKNKSKSKSKSKPKSKSKSKRK